MELTSYFSYISEMNFHSSKNKKIYSKKSPYIFSKKKFCHILGKSKVSFISFET